MMTMKAMGRALSAAIGACVLIYASTPLAAEAPPTPPKGLSTKQMEGKVGPYVVGMNLLLHDHVAFSSGHYFYASKLVDIPLKGRIEGESVTLEEPDGGVFHLRLVSNGSAKGQVLTFYTSTGLEGSWTKGSKTLPVVLQFTTGYDGPPRARRYSHVTSESDAAFERRVQAFLRAVLSGDKKGAAQLVSYPLAVNGPRPLVVRTEADLLANWNRIFTPRLIARLRGALPHEMFVRNGAAMVSGGAVWFDDKGAVAINPVR